MAKCKFYSDYIEGVGECVCGYDKVNHNGPILLCTHKDEEDNCTCFEPIEYKLDFTGANIAKLNIDENKVMDSKTLTIQNCDKIILKPKSLEVEVKIGKDNFDDFDFIVVNGHKFKKVKEWI